jgi:hypothetical protein
LSLTKSNDVRTSGGDDLSRGGGGEWYTCARIEERGCGRGLTLWDRSARGFAAHQKWCHSGDGG